MTPLTLRVRRGADTPIGFEMSGPTGVDLTGKSAALIVKVNRVNRTFAAAITVTPASGSVVASSLALVQLPRDYTASLPGGRGASAELHVTESTGAVRVLWQGQIIGIGGI